MKRFELVRVTRKDGENRPGVADNRNQVVFPFIHMTSAIRALGLFQACPRESRTFHSNHIASYKKVQSVNS